MNDGDCISLYDKPPPEALYQSGLAYLGKEDKMDLSGDVGLLSKSDAFPDKE